MITGTVQDDPARLAEPDAGEGGDAGKGLRGDGLGELIRYLVVGGLTTLVSLSVYYGLVFTVLDAKRPVQLQAANVISWIAAVSFAYVTNRIFVFRSRSRRILREAGSFFGARLGTLFMEMALMFLLVTVLGWNDRLVKLLMQVLVTVLNYLFSRLLVFRKTR